MNAAGAAQRLVAARRGGARVVTLGGDLQPATMDDAYAVQEETLRLLGATHAGWKVGSTSPTTEIIAAPLIATLVAGSPAKFGATPESFRAVEAELALSIGRELPARARPYSEDEAWAAVAAAHVAIEFLDTRFADRRAQSPAALLADMQNNGGFSYGPGNPVAAVDFLGAKASLLVNGKEEKSAIGGNPAGHPRRLLAWLANHAASRGRPLKPGDMVTTGSHTGITIAPVGAHVVVRFDGLGESVLDIVPA